MPVALQPILLGTPDLADLRTVVYDGRTALMVGNVVLAVYDNGDVGMRNLALISLTDMGFPVHVVARLVGLTPEYGSELRGQVRRQGSARLVRGRGRPSKLTPVQLRQARAWKAAGVLDAEIARRLNVSHKTAARAVGGVEVVVQEELNLAATQPADTGGAPDADTAEVSGRPEDLPAAPVESTVDDDGSSGAGGASMPAQTSAVGAARISTGSFCTRYAGAALLHAFVDRIDAAGIFAAALAAGGDRAGLRFDDLAVLTATSMVFGLGFASLEQAKHPDRSQVGPVAGVDVLPELRTLRPRLAAIADRCDPLGLQRALAAAMLAVEPNLSGVYFVDEHFMPYTGALPVGSGWNTKRRHAEPGRIDTTICDPKGRAVCFTSGEPSGLATSLPTVLDQLQHIVGPDAPIMLGFDRGGAYPATFRACRNRNVHWITYRRAPLVAPTGLPIHTTITHPRRKPTTVAYADETVTINKYGQARQITLFEQGRPVLQILTSDTTTCPTALILFMRARWRIENLFKYLDFYGIDYLTDYHATIQTNTRKIDNSERKKLKAELKELTTERDRLHERVGQLHTDRAITITELNHQSTTAQRRIHTLDQQISELQQQLKTVPAKLPANLIDPDANRAVHRTHRRALQMVLRLLAANAENWLAHHLNAYLQDNNEYRATTRNLLHLAGTITYTETTVNIELNRPNTPRLAHALALLLDEINQTPAHIPGDPRPITYTLKPPST
jgi:chaperonin cofactor prefoldin